MRPSGSAAALLVSLLSAPAAVAEGVRNSGNELLERCSAGPSTVEHGVCLGFVLAAVDHTEWVSFDIDAKHRVCFPDGVTVGQLTDTFVLFLQAHPEQRHRRAIALAQDAWHKAFPCQQDSQSE
jgi:hypothetical protein